MRLITVLIFAVILLIVLCLKCYMYNGIRLVGKSQIIIIGVLLLSNFVAIVSGIDKGISVIGLFRFLCAVFWMLIIVQMNCEDRLRVMHVIPYSGIAMIIICGLLYLIPVLKKWVFDGERLGGMFQYSNTFAVYLLVGIIVLSYIELDIGVFVVMNLLLLMGILWTGSRGVFVLTIITYIFLLVNVQCKRKGIVVTIFAAIIVSILSALILGMTGVINRFSDISFGTSTILGRLLYSEDALLLLSNKPLGLGYMGYFYIQPYIQHGLYTVRFVHNDWLQAGLDQGVAALIIYIVFFFKNIIKQWDSNRRNAIILIIVGCHMIIDYDCEFMVIVLCILSSMNWEDDSMINISSKKIMCFAFVLIPLYLWLS